MNEANEEIKRSSRSRIVGIDVLRGLAALTVVFSHYIPFWNERHYALSLSVPNSLGFYAVNLFFAISGYVIFSTLQKCTNARQFLILRASRLYPTYWASIFFVAIASTLLFDKDLWVGGIVTNLTMFQEFFGYPNIDNVYWSLTVELAFYMNLAWLFALRWTSNAPRLCVIWLVLACLWHLLGADHRVDRDYVEMLFAFDFSYYFVIGIITYDTLVNGLRRIHYVLAPLIAVTAVLIGGIESLIVATLVATLMMLGSRQRLDFLANRTTLFFGSISFSLYLVHRNLGYLALSKLYELDTPAWIAISVTVLGAIGVAALLTFVIEQPSLRYLRTRLVEPETR